MLITPWVYQCEYFSWSLVDRQRYLRPKKRTCTKMERTSSWYPRESLLPGILPFTTLCLALCFDKCKSIFFIFYFHARFYKFTTISILKGKSLWERDIIEGALWNNCVWILCLWVLCIQKLHECVIIYICLLHITFCLLKLYIFMTDDQQILSTSYWGWECLGKLFKVTNIYF